MKTLDLYVMSEQELLEVNGGCAYCLPDVIIRFPFPGPTFPFPGPTFPFPDILF